MAAQLETTLLMFEKECKLKKLVIQNQTDQFGRFVGQLFSVWDTERKVLVFPLHPKRQAAQNFIDQLEFNFG